MKALSFVTWAMHIVFGLRHSVESTHASGRPPSRHGSGGDASPGQTGRTVLHLETPIFRVSCFLSCYSFLPAVRKLIVNGFSRISVWIEQGCLTTSSGMMYHVCRIRHSALPHVEHGSPRCLSAPPARRSVARMLDALLHSPNPPTVTCLPPLSINLPPAFAPGPHLRHGGIEVRHQPRQPDGPRPTSSSHRGSVG
jgi:hypothetical protein